MIPATTWSIHPGDTRASLARLPERSVRCCVTSPPYWGLRDYGHDGQIGLEQTPAAYVASMVEVFAAVRRVLTDDGTLWLNLGDSFASTTKGSGGPDSSSTLVGTKAEGNGQRMAPRKMTLTDGIKPKDLVGIPWRVAFALQADGWYLRSDIIWHKPNPMPESVTDRPTKAHEYLFLLAKSERYFYDAGAIAEPAAYPDDKRRPLGSKGAWQMDGREQRENGGGVAYEHDTSTRNKRDVWTIGTQPYSGAHFATFPEALVEPCILAGSAVGDTVLDPFSGSGTTGAVAVRHGRNYIGCELNPAYIALSEKRIGDEAPLFVAGGAA